MIVGSRCLALESTSQLSYEVVVPTSHPLREVPVLPHPPAVGTVIYSKFSSPNRCAVIAHDFNL